MEAEHQLELIQNAVLGIIILMSMTVLLSLISKKVKFLPYTVLLVLVGFIIQPGLIPPLDAMRLSPGVVFYIILPILLFESAFNLDYSEFRRVLTPAFLFATFGLLISALVVALPLYLFFDIEFFSALLFGSIISSTDPIAVLTIFKELGVPRKLQLLVDAESFFNDGTSVILCKLLLAITLGVAGLDSNREMLILSSAGNFVFLLVGGAIVGIVLGWLFAQIISSVRNDSPAEIILTLILATSVFIVAEHFLHVSGIIAVLVAGLIMGNYGRSKISPKVSHEMHQTWSMLVFVFSSMIFLLIGYEIHISQLIKHLNIIGIIILFLLLGRALSMYVVGIIYNLRKKPSGKIPWAWLHILNIGGLRGALPLVILLLIPQEFVYRELFIDITLGIIFFTLIVNATFLKTLIHKLNISKFSVANEFEVKIVELLVFERVLRSLDKMKSSKEIRDNIYEKHKTELRNNITETSKSIDQFLNEANNKTYAEEIKMILDRYCLNIEKSAYKSLYKRTVIDEGIYRKLISSIKLQQTEIENGVSMFKDLEKHDKYLITELNRAFEDTLSFGNLIHNLRGIKVTEKIQDYYLYHKARVIGNLTVMGELTSFPTDRLGVFNEKVISKKISQYQSVFEYNQKALESIENLFPQIADQVEEIIFEHESDDILSNMIHELGEEERISDKVLTNLDLKI